jgi:repressor LexA
MSKHKQPMNDRHEAIMGFIELYISEHHYSPSMREISEAVKLSSTSLASYYLDRLQEEGMIRKDPHVSRSIVVVEWG